MEHQLTLEDAKVRHGPKFRVAALGAIGKKPGGGEYRIIFDATHGVLTNKHTRVQSQVRCPTVDDVKTVIHEMSKEQRPHFSVQFDVWKAHWQVYVLEKDWCYQACMVEGDLAEDGRELCWIYSVGTSHWLVTGGAEKAPASCGLASCWSRNVPCGRSPRRRRQPAGTAPTLPSISAVGALLILEALAVPIAWHKVRGGLSCDFVGLHFDSGSFLVSISESRACWVAA